VVACAAVGAGVALAQELGLLMYVECSSKANSNVQEVIHLGIKAPLLKAAGLLRLHHTNSRGRGSDKAKKKKTTKKAGKRDQCSMQ
jgi:hypothetical protein